MTCFHPLTAWKNTRARLDTPSEQYYEEKKITFKKPKNSCYKEIQIPCNRCLGCRLDHASMWSNRIMLEAKNWKKCCFVTLTYNNPHLPINDIDLTTLKKKDLQDFLKRLRYYEKGAETWENPITGKEENPIRYFACGEYGNNGTRAEIGGNPHFHLAIFNWEPKDLIKYKQNRHGDWSFKSASLQKIWGKGFVVIEELNYKTASYIARYVQKKAGLSPIHREYTGKFEYEPKIDERNGQEFMHKKREIEKIEHLQEPEFITMSRAVGIGRKYWEENKEKIKRNKGIFLKIKEKLHLKPIPKYFEKLWEKENYEEYYRYKYEKQKEGEKHRIEIISKIKLPDGSTDEMKWHFYLETQEKILYEKADYLKRDEFI